MMMLLETAVAMGWNLGGGSSRFLLEQGSHDTCVPPLPQPFTRSGAFASSPWYLGLGCCPLLPAADGKSLAEGQLAPAGQEVERSTLRENTFV